MVDMTLVLFGFFSNFLPLFFKKYLSPFLPLLQDQDQFIKFGENSFIIDSFESEFFTFIFIGITLQLIMSLSLTSMYASQVP